MGFLDFATNTFSGMSRFYFTKYIMAVFFGRSNCWLSARHWRSRRNISIPVKAGRILSRPNLTRSLMKPLLEGQARCKHTHNVLALPSNISAF